MLIGQFNSIEKVSSGYKIVCENADILIIFMNKDIFRIRVSFSRNLDVEQSYSLVKTAWADRNDELFENERETKRGKKERYSGWQAHETAAS